MKEYRICVTETVSGIFCVEAESEDEAIRIAGEKYRKSIFINEPGELLDVDFTVISDE